MRVVTVDPTTDQLWERLLATRSSDVFHAPGWLRVLRSTYGFPIEARILVDHTAVPLAGFVYSPIADLMDPRVVSLPFTDFCDPLVSDSTQWAAVSEGVLADGNRVHMRCLHSSVPLSDPLLTCTGRARWHAVDLARPSDVIWGEIDSSARRSIRKARKEGVEVRAGKGIDDLRAFFELHLRVRKNKYGLLAQPWPFFENIWNHLLSQDHGVLMLAERGGELLGGVLFLEWSDTLYYKFNASDSEQLAVRPNDLVIWSGIEHALARGLRRLDFGLSDWDQEGLVRFKRKYATEEKTIHMLQHMPPGAPSVREVEARALLPQITELLTGPEIPDSVTAQAGAILYRYFT
jgi:CelD/BcsL family acetyltransferase involved in cellulose biosynthesis